MALYVSEAWLKDYCQRTGQRMPRVHTNPSHDPEPGTVLVDLDENKRQQLFDADLQPRRSKYGNRKTEAGGRVFDSMHEAQVFEQLTLQVQAGAYLAVMCQVTFALPGGVKYRADFVTLNPDGTFTVFDAKSEATRRDKAYRIKYRQMKACLGITIQEV